MSGQKHSSMPSTASCPLCQAWVSSPNEKAFSTGTPIDAKDAHSMLVLGYWLARADKVIRPLCSSHRQMCERLDRAKNQLEQNEALRFRQS